MTITTTTTTTTTSERSKKKREGADPLQNPPNKQKEFGRGIRESREIFCGPNLSLDDGEWSVVGVEEEEGQLAISISSLSAASLVTGLGFLWLILLVCWHIEQEACACLSASPCLGGCITVYVTIKDVGGAGPTAVELSRRQCTCYMQNPLKKRYPPALGGYVASTLDTARNGEITDRMTEGFDSRPRSVALPW